jgi:hypothetical protein
MSILIATQEELNLLFDNNPEKIKIFIDIMSRIIGEITMRTVNVPFINLNEVTK